jgi:hypothetical protein
MILDPHDILMDGPICLKCGSANLRYYRDDGIGGDGTCRVQCRKCGLDWEFDEEEEEEAKP